MAEREFAAADQRLGEAAAAGQSDAEVYEAVAEAWVRQIEMALARGKSTEVAYTVAIAACDKITVAEPESVAGSLKKAYAALMSIANFGGGVSTAERVQHCIASAEAVLQKQPGHPYASDAAASCYGLAAEQIIAQGENAEPLYRKALELLEPALRQSPNFLWGLNDLATTFTTLGAYQQLRGNPVARESLEKALWYFAKAASLDPTYQMALQNSLGTRPYLASEARSEEDLKAILTQADDELARCTAINSQATQCFNNYFQIYVRAAGRIFQAGKDPQPLLARAEQNLAATRKLGGNFLDTEQYAALLELIEARQRLRSLQDPGAALAAFQAALNRCFALAASDATCRMLEIQGHWVEADWLVAQRKPPAPVLNRALEKAVRATQAPGASSDAWQALAETYLRLARASGARATAATQYVESGLTASSKIFALNPNHALGHETRGRLELLRAEAAPQGELRRAAAQAAAGELAQAQKSDTLRAGELAPLLAQAKALDATP